MSYLQIELGGKLRGLKFNMIAIEEIAKQNTTDSKYGFIYSMIYGGMYGCSVVKKEEIDYTYEDVSEWVDAMENQEEIVAKVTATLTETQNWKRVLNKQETPENEEDKKKV